MEAKQSNFGDGIFAIRDLPKGQIITLFNGVRIPQETIDLEGRVEEETWMYRIQVSHCGRGAIDIPLGFGSLSKYNATLGKRVMKCDRNVIV